MSVNVCAVVHFRMADIVKSSARYKQSFKLNDCVSIPADFFGSVFQQIIIAAGEIKIIGRVVDVEHLGKLSIKWDCDDSIGYWASSSQVEAYH